MCVGPLAGPRPPKPPTPQGPAPTVKAAAKGPEYVEPEKIKDELHSSLNSYCNYAKSMRL